MRRDGKNYRWLIAADWLLTAIIFIGDLVVPLGVAGGILYVVVVLVAMWLSRRQVFVFAACSTALTVVGFLLSPEEYSTTLLANRSLSVFAIWVVAVLGLRVRQLAYDVVRQARIIDEVHDGIVVIDRGGRIDYSNKGAEAVFGYSNRELIGRHASSLFVVEHGDGRDRMFLEHVLSKETFEMALKGVRKDGGQFLAHQWLMRRYDDAGESSGVILHVTDLSQHQPAEEAARRMETFYRDLLNKLPLQVALFDTEGRFLYLNPASLSSPTMRDWIIGRTEREYFEKAERNLSAMEDREVQFKRALTEKRPIHFEEVFQTRSGESRCFSHGFFPVVDSVGDVTTVLGFRYDITEHRRAELKLSESLARLNAIFDAAGDGIMTIDQEGVIESANTAAIRLLGYGREEITKMEIDDVLFPCDTDRPSTRAPFNLEDWHETSDGHSEVCGRRKGGDTFPAELTLTDLKLGDRQVFTAILRDVTDRRRAETKLRRYNDRLEGLRRIDHSILTAQSRRAVAEVAGRHLLQMTSAARVGIILLDGSGDTSDMLSILDDGSVHHDSILSDHDLRCVNHLFDTSDASSDRDDADEATADPVPIITYEQSRIDIPLRIQDSLIGVLVLERTDMKAFAESDVEIASDVAGLLAVALHDARLFEEVDSSRERLQTLSRRLVEVQEEERRRLARELHDEVGQALTGLKLSLETADRLVDSQGEGSLGEAKDIVRQLLGRVRNLSLNLRPAMLDDLGLVPALLWLVDRYERQTQITVEFRHQIDGRLGTDTETAAYRIVQEALTNVARHARTDQAAVLVTASDGQLLVTVKDSGVGFSGRAIMSDASRAGLSGLQERVGLLKGTLVVETAPGQGTCVTATLPIPETLV